MTVIPIGSDTAPFMENLFLYYYGNKLLLHTKNGDLRKALRFSYTFRSTDNFCAINDHIKFDRSFNNIYSSELQLKTKTFQLPKHHF